MWLFARQRVGAAVAEKEAKLQSEHGAEKLALSTRLATSEANATTAAARVAELQREGEERERALAELRAAKSEADARLAALEMQISEERQQGAEKLAILDDAQKKLTTHRSSNWRRRRSGSFRKRRVETSRRSSRPSPSC